MAWYTPVDPPAPLSSVLACVWTARPVGRHLLVPDACCDLLWLSTGSMWLCGPDTHAFSFELAQGTEAVGVRFRPGYAGQVLGVDVAAIRDLRVKVSPPQGSHGPHPAGRLDALVSHVEASVSAVRRLHRWPDIVLDLLAAHPRLSTADLAAAVGLSTRQVHRRALSHFGFGTSTLARILRFQRFAAHANLLGAQAPRTLAELAHRAGYADQAHLGRECRQIAGMTPARFVSESFATFPDMSDPYKTAAPLVGTLAR